MAEILQNKLGGLNERALPTDSVGFNRLMAAYAAEVGLMARVPGKALLSRQDGPVFAILQFWTPFGYAQGLFQFSDKISLDPWVLPAFHLPLTLDGQITTAEVSLPNIEPNTTTGTFTPTDDTRSGMHGGSGRRPRKVLVEDEVVNILPYLTIFEQLMDNADFTNDNPYTPGVLPDAPAFINADWGPAVPGGTFQAVVYKRADIGWAYNYDALAYWNTYRETTGKKISFILDLETLAFDYGLSLDDILDLKLEFDLTQFKYSAPSSEGGDIYSAALQPKETITESISINDPGFNFEIEAGGRQLSGMHDQYGTYNGNFISSSKTFKQALMTYYTWRM